MSMVYKNLLITGFDPFGGAPVNTSWDAVSGLPDVIGGWKVHKRQIPTVFGKAAAIVSEYVEEIGADAIICVGQAGGRTAVTPEYVAINLRHANIADNEGNLLKETRIVSDAPDGLFATVPVVKMVDAIVAAGLKGAVSYSAGAFVCNDTLFSLLWKYRNSVKKIGFIHVPYLPGQTTENAPCMTLDEIRRCLIAAIGCM